MIFRFLLLSDEVEDFRREIQIDGDSSFLDLHNAIVKSVNFKDGQMSSFFLCNEDWEKEQEITLVEMDTSSEEDSYTMEGTTLSDFLEDEKQKLMYVFDYLTERVFFMELREIIPGKHLENAICTKSSGEAPPQFIEFDTSFTTSPSIDTDELFYGDESYNLDELDSEGFEGLDNIPSDSEEF